MLSVENVSIARGNFSLRDVSFRVDAGEYLVLLGASGAGKTLLLEALAGFHACESGRIVLDGDDITLNRMSDRRLALVQQDRTLFPHMSSAANIAYGLKARGVRGGEAREQAVRLARRVGGEALLHRKPATLSGGEAQRVSLARALATRPACLLLDEPLSALDTHARAQLRAVLRDIGRGGQTVIHVTHDYEEAVSLADRVGVLEAGRIAQIGTPNEIFQHPKSEFVARFAGIKNFLRGTLEPAPEIPGATRRFATGGLVIAVLTNASAGEGYLILGSEDITLSAARPHGSAQNTFQGTVADVAGAAVGVEVIVDVGVEIAALVTENAVEQMGLQPGVKVWLSFKATAGKFVDG